MAGGPARAPGPATPPIHLPPPILAVAPGPGPGPSQVGCRGGSRYLEGCWDSLTWKWKGLRFLGFLVSRILGFRVAWFLGFEVSWFQSFKDSMIPYYQIPSSCFLIDIDLTSKIFRMSLDGSSGLSGARLFPTFSNNMKSTILKLPNRIFSKMLWDPSWIFKSILGSPKINNIGVGAQGHVRKSRNQRNEGFEGSHIANRKVISPNWSRIILRSF